MAVLVAALPAVAGCHQDDSLRNAPTSIPCTQALAFFDQTSLPTGATGARCSTQHFLDTVVYLEFEADHDAVDQWLAALPDAPQLDDHGCSSSVLCAEASFTPRAAGGADYVRLYADSIPGSDNRLAVTIQSFNT
ncbi:MAG: hypothetical protein FWF02_06445 [Micrococcales bacterium]|nr:hypothetical protein [Micrococcales bacterium]